ncbi:hypothetical protein, partial [Enterococcus faecalis]|uniref:hypothetical protein n=1 Tax=Enterococcus faecalis TaxID=1351 RepID=UPI0020134830
VRLLSFCSSLEEPYLQLRLWINQADQKREAVRRKQFQAKIPVKNQVRIKVSLLQNLKVLRPALIIIPVHRQVLRMFRLNGLRSA